MPARVVRAGQDDQQVRILGRDLGEAADEVHGRVARHAQVHQRQVPQGVPQDLDPGERVGGQGIAEADDASAWLQREGLDRPQVALRSKDARGGRAGGSGEPLVTRGPLGVKEADGVAHRPTQSAPGAAPRPTSVAPG
jgi:hypothetical protein